MRAGEHAYRTLRNEIQSGALPAGAVLVEVEQAARLGVSRTPLREALGRLVADGLVAQQSPRVTVVTDVDRDDIRALFEIVVPWRRRRRDSPQPVRTAPSSPRSPTSSARRTSPAARRSTRTTASSRGSTKPSTRRSRTTT